MQRLEFNLVGPIPFNSGTNVGIIKDKQQVLSTYLTLIKSSSYWDVANLDITGSNYEALVIRPVITTNTDQRIIITMNATASANAWGNRDQGTADTNSGGHLQVGLCPTSASYTNGNYISDVPFGTNRRWSRYWSAANIAGTDGLQFAYLIESEETIMIGSMGHAAVNVGGYLGAILLPFDSGSGEQGGRIFGLFTEPDNINNFNTSQTGWGEHSITGLQEHAGIFIVSGGNPNNPIGSNGNIDNMIEHLAHYNFLTIVNDMASGVRGDYRTSEETSVVLPYVYRSNWSATRIIGMGRQFYMFNDYPLFSNLVTQSNGEFGSVGIVVNTSIVAGGTEAMLFSNVDI